MLCICYDVRGNWQSVQGTGWQTSYSSNALNQHSSHSSNNDAIQSTSALSYDVSSNLLSHNRAGQGGSSYLYDEENQLCSITVRDGVGAPVRKSEWVCDGADRKVIWQPQSETRRIYDGMMSLPSTSKASCAGSTSRSTSRRTAKMCSSSCASWDWTSKPGHYSLKHPVSFVRKCFLNTSWDLAEHEAALQWRTARRSMTSTTSAGWAGLAR